MVDHPSHVTRFSDSSFYDEICVLCGTTDGSGGLLEASCPVGKNLKKSHTLEVLYSPERTEHKRVRCKTCGETSVDLLASFDCSNPAVKESIVQDIDVQRKIEGTDGREGKSWLEAAPDMTDAVLEHVRNAELNSVCPDRPAILDKPIEGNVVAAIEPVDGQHYARPIPRQTTDYESFKFSLDALFRKHLAHAPATGEVARAIEALRQTIRQMDWAFGLKEEMQSAARTVVVNVDPKELSLTEKIGKLIYEDAKKIGMNTAIRHTPRQNTAKEAVLTTARQNMATDESIAAKEADLMAAHKERLRLAALEDYVSADGKGPQHGMKLPDAEFVPLYRSEKDA